MFNTHFKKFYIASALRNHLQALELAEVLKVLGMVPTYEWYLLKDEPTNGPEAITLAEKEVKAVQEADVLFVIMPCGRGAYTEMGIALGINLPIFVLAADENATMISITGGSWGYKHLFSSHPNVMSLFGSPAKILGELLKAINSEPPPTVSSLGPSSYQTTDDI